MTDSIESIGQGEISFLDTGMRIHYRLHTDEFVSTNSWVTARFRRVNYLGIKDAPSRHNHDHPRGFDGGQ